MTTTAKTLRAAKALIDAPEKWTQNALARNQNVRPCSAQDPDATCFYIIGATVRVKHAYSKATNILMQVARSKGFDSVGDFNDDAKTTHADVMTFFDSAIALAESTA